MIEVSDLEFTYKKTGVKAVRKLDFKIDKGEIFGFLGPSGAGKTTTQKILIGLLPSYKGSAVILGTERNKWGKEFYERIGVAFEMPNLYTKLTAFENLELIGSYYKNNLLDIDKLLDKVGLLPFRDEKTEAFSKGMKVRLNFIRSLLHDPDILFFDEPTSGLDPVNSKIVKDIIKDIKNEGKTVFLTTHNMMVADQLCDRVAFIVDGKINVIDTPDNLKVKYGKKSVKVEYCTENGTYADEFSLKEIAKSKKFLDILQSGCIKTIHSMEATLEEIFIKITGRELL